MWARETDATCQPARAQELHNPLEAAGGLDLKAPHAGPGVEPGRKGADLPSFIENASWSSLSYVAARSVPEVPPLLREWWMSDHVISPEAGTGQVVGRAGF